MYLDTSALKYDFDVYFGDFPSIDIDGLVTDVQEQEPEDKYETVGARDYEAEKALAAEAGLEESELQAFTLTQRGIEVSIVVRTGQSPAKKLIETFPGFIGPKQREAMENHQAWALLSAKQVDENPDVPPIERVFLLVKVAAGLCCEQGGLGAAHRHAGIVKPAYGYTTPRSVSKMLGQSMWEVNRGEEGLFSMVAGVFPARIGEKTFIISTGMAFLGLPDLVYEVTDREIAGHVRECMEGTCRYLILSGPILDVGHTIGPTEHALLRFAEPPADFKHPFPTLTVLFVEDDGNTDAPPSD